MVVFLSVQLFSEGKLYSSTSLIYIYCIAYRNIVSRRNIRIYPGTRRGFLRSSGQRWINWSPELWFGGTKDPWLFNLQYRQAPVHNPIILCNFLYLFSCAFKLLELNENLRCIILGTYCLNTKNKVLLARCFANRTGKSRGISCLSRDL